jgi:hypothetical protein
VGYVHFAAEDGFERFLPVSFALLVDAVAVVEEIFDAEHVAVVGDGHAFHAVVDSFVDKPLYTRLSVEDRVISVYVEVYEILHNVKLWSVKLRHYLDIAKRKIIKVCAIYKKSLTLHPS